VRWPRALKVINTCWGFVGFFDFSKKVISRVEAEVTIPRAPGFEGWELSTSSKCGVRGNAVMSGEGEHYPKDPASANFEPLFEKGRVQVKKCLYLFFFATFQSALGARTWLGGKEKVKLRGSGLTMEPLSCDYEGRRF
jgi:hypothetical protein